MPAHSTLTGADLHEPKGVDAATVDTVYIANGTGSGAWVKPAANSVTVLDTAGVFTSSDVEGALNELYGSFGIVDGVFLDISSTETVLLPVPFSCVVEEISVTLANAITVANSTVTVTRSDGGSMGTALTITQLGSAEGTRFTFTPTANNDLTFPTHSYVKLVSDGGSTTTARAYVQMKIKRV